MFAIKLKGNIKLMDVINSVVIEPFSIVCHNRYKTRDEAQRKLDLINKAFPSGINNREIVEVVI